LCQGKRAAAGGGATICRIDLYVVGSWQIFVVEILDMVGGEYIAKNLKCLNEDGRLVQIAFLQGAKVEVNFAQLMMRRLTFTGSTLRPQSNLQKAQIASELKEKVWPLLRKGNIEPEIDSEFSLKEATEAHRRMESSAHIGKIVLKVG
jgi:NADPH2:quinone reductase